MPHLFVFLLKVNVALLAFCAGYYLVLRRLTFYTLNRVYLVGAILFASVYPRINLSGFFIRHPAATEPMQSIVFDLQSSPRQFIQPMVQHRGYWQAAEAIFWVGALILAGRLLIQFISLYRIYRRSRGGSLMGHKVRLIDSDGGPFSFWKNIYINPNKHEPGDLKAILQHEQIHVSEWHTADILLAEISTIFYWFNPGIWLMKKAIRENIEFITDRKILRNGTDSKQYQYSLVNVSFAAVPQGIVNHFNISTIKKRIIMMNAKRSSKLNLTRYAFLVPAVVALLMVFTISRAALVKKHITTGKLHKLGQPTAAATTAEIKRRQAPANTVVAGVTTTMSRGAYTRMQAEGITGMDTNRKVHIHYKDVDIVSEKPSMYIVDGVVTKDYDISKVDTGQIRSINIGTADGKTVVYVETKNGTSARNIKTIRINGHDGETYQGMYVNGYIIDSLKKGNGKIGFDTVYLNGTMNSAPMKYRVESSNIRPMLKTYSYNNKPATLYKQPFSTVYTTRANADNEVTLSDLSSKLVIINGNVATKADLKKLSAFDIDRMVLKTDEETKELYGDKAKNGVVFILTKKRG